jgi:hypothetical protein
VAEVKPLSEDLSKLAGIGLQALDFIESGNKPPQAWLDQQRAALDAAKKPRAELLLMIAPSIEKLVNTAAGTF